MNPTRPSQHGKHPVFSKILHILTRFQTLPPWIVIVSTIPPFFLLALFIVWARLPESLLYLGMIPIALLALYHEQRITYLGCGAILTMLALWTAGRLSADFSESLKTIAMSGLAVLVLAELLYTLSTARRRAEAALRESEARYRAIFDASPNPMSITEPAAQGGRYIEINEAYLRVTGYRREQLIGRSPLELSFWHNKAQRDEVVARLERDKTVDNLECEFRLADGRVITGMLSARMVSLGGQSYVLSVVRDISERKRALEALRQSQAQIQAILSAVPIILWAVDGTGRFILVEGQALATIGIHPQEVIGRSIWEFYAENPDGARQIERVLNGETLTITQKIHGLIFESRLVPFFDPTSQTNGAIIVSVDITEREKAQNAQRELAMLLEATLNAIPDLIGIQGPDHQVIRYNEAGYRFLNMTPEEVIGKKCYELIGRTQPCQICATGEVYRTKAPAQLEHYEPSMDLWLDARAYPILDEQGNVIRVIEHVRDITAQKKAEQEKERLHERLMQSQKMEAVGRLAGGIAHDFNNMLTAIQGYTELLLQTFSTNPPDRWPPPAQICADLQEIKAASGRAQSLTQQLLAFSRKQILQPHVIRLSETLSNLERMLRPLLGEDIQISRHLPPDGDYIRADPTQIEQIVMNLAVNARDAMPDGGRLTFEVTLLTLDEEFVHAHPGLHPGDYVQLSVSDTGIGMSDEVQAHLFEPFFTTKDKSKGTGLGLATVYAIVEQLGGYIAAYSEVGIGSTFKIYLPRVADKPEAKPVVETLHMPVGNETILLAEDEEMVRSLLVRTLKRCGYTVLVAERPADALALARSHPEPIDLLITDVVMPEMGGKELAVRLVQIHPETRVLFISGYTDNAIVHHGVLDPGIHFIQKPFSPHRLAQEVRNMLSKK